MGEFTQSLLKLTDFPFSYSLLSLLALIFGQGGGIEKLSFNEIGPLLVLMGLVATTLSICDPLGALQHMILKLRTSDFRIENLAELLLDTKIFGITSAQILHPLYYIVFTYGPKIIEHADVDVDLLQRYPNEENIDVSPELNKINQSEVPTKIRFVTGIKNKTIKSKWITAEIDRITALIYFIIVISIFLIAITFFPNFLQLFVHSFNDNTSIYAAVWIFVLLALSGVSYMFIVRIKGLQSKAVSVFRYLTALESIRTESQKYEDTLDDIERYLDNNDWTLVEYWLDRIELDYVEMVLGIKYHESKSIL